MKLRNLVPTLLAFVALGMVTLAALSIAPPNHHFTGKITDSMCPQADHSKVRRGPTDAECIEACVHMYGASYVLYDGETTYALSDQKTPEKFLGQSVRVIGTLDAKTKTIQVDSIVDTNIDFLAVAYLVVVAIFFVYLFSVARRAARLEDEIASLRRQIEET
jgi:hypothetical protein